MGKFNYFNLKGIGIKKCFLILTLNLFLLWAFGHNAFATLINFDDVVGGTLINNYYSGLNVTFGCFNGINSSYNQCTGNAYAVNNGSLAISPPNSIGLTPSVSTIYEDSGYLKASFSSPVSSVSIDVKPYMQIADWSPPINNEPFLQAFDTNGNYLGADWYDLYQSCELRETLTITRPTNDIKFVAFSSSSTLGGPYVFGQFDNLQFAMVNNPKVLSIAKVGSGSGTVRSSTWKLDCGTVCQEDYGENFVAELSTIPDPGSAFAGWGGDCTGSAPSTSVTMDANKTCTANFYRQSALPKSGPALTWGSIPASNIPVEVNGLTDVVAVSAGYMFTLALKSDGTVWAWGTNAYGQLGDGTSGNSKLTPVEVVNPEGTGPLTDVVAIAAGSSHSMALTNTGAIYTWGANWNGQLGDGTYQNRSRPVRVYLEYGSSVGCYTHFIAIAAGYDHSLALNGSDGTVWAWGNNDHGQLGNGVIGGSDPTPGPFSVINLTDVVRISAGGLHSLAIKRDGSAWAWGWNSYGQLGDGTTNDSATPVKVGGLSNVYHIAGGYQHTIAIAKKDCPFCLPNTMRVFTWGYNWDGQLGIGTMSDSIPHPNPIIVSDIGLFDAPISVEAGMNYSFAQKGDGKFWAWGYNWDGELGVGTSGDRYSQPQYVSGLDGAKWVSGGYYQSAAIRRMQSATFISQSVPTTMTAGANYNVSITMKNTGDTTWTAIDEYRLGSQNPTDNNTWGLQRVNVPNTVAPGQEVTFNFTVTAPTTSGTYNFQWRMVQEMVEWFGDLTQNVTITVVPSYTLTVMKEGVGSNYGHVGSYPQGIDCGIDCTEVYVNGTQVELVAWTEYTFPMYDFVGWSGDPDCSDEIVTMNDNKTCIANFDIVKVSLTVSKTGTGNGTVTSDPVGISCGIDCSKVYDSGTIVTLTAIADTGSVFIGWDGWDCNTLGTEPVIQLYMTDEDYTSCIAKFELVMHDLTVYKNGSGTVTSSPVGINCGVDCTKPYGYGTIVTLTAIADIGSIFTGWSGACSGNGTCTVTMDATKSVTATFTLIQYPLDVTKSGNGSGTVTSSPPGISCDPDCTEPYNYGTMVTLTAAPATGSTFTGWSGNCSGQGTCTVTMDAAKSVTATFTLKKYLLTITKYEYGNGSGTVTSSPAGINCGIYCSELYDYGIVVTLTATPATGSTFTGWSFGECAGTGTCTVTMDANKSVTATFILNQYTLTVNKTGNGTILSTIPGINCGDDCTELYDQGTMVTLNAAADFGYTFGGWSGACSGLATTCTVTMDSDKAATATFTPIEYYLTVDNTGGTGSGTITSSPVGIDCGNDCAQPYSSGTVVTLTAAASVNSTFAGWGGACSGALITCDVTMDAAKWVTATFNTTLPYISLSITPDSTSIPRGGTLGYTVTVTNNTSTTQTFKYWTYVNLPNGSRYPVTGELFGPVTVTLSAGQTKSAHLTQKIPTVAPLGSYTYHTQVGPYPGIWDAKSFTFNVTSSALSPQGDIQDSWKTLENGLTE